MALFLEVVTFLGRQERYARGLSTSLSYHQQSIPLHKLMEVDPSPTTLVGDSEPADSKVWEQYNHHARRRDKLLLKDWGSSIDGLLLFVRFYKISIILSIYTISGRHLRRGRHLLLRRESQDAGRRSPEINSTTTRFYGGSGPQYINASAVAFTFFRTGEVGDSRERILVH